MAELWQEQLKNALTSVEEASGYAFAGDMNSEVESRYRTLVPPYYLSLIDKEDPEDPIAKMAFPTSSEMAPVVAGLRDPIGDLAKGVAKRITHRYGDRALLHVTNLCPMYCRFCFRKNLMNEKDEDLYSGDYAEAMAYLGTHPEIQELILTGGDPWMLSDDKLRHLVDQIAESAPQVKRLRFHSRMPVTLPMRITDGLLAAIHRPSRFQTVVVTHFNHPREITAEASKALALLRNSGILVLNQTVLLKGVNDSAAILRELFQGLGWLGVLPYYLHHCDLVEGGEHFRTSIGRGKAIWAELRGTLPGYLIPEYIMEIPGGEGKVPVGSDFLKEQINGAYLVKNTPYLDPLN